mmetsp:Transcript_23573/g.44846  ORF Transcript_23573/g.44846 Transcript_23573/m.44846 type:complete len:103 (-) Transcript_23573:2500-2808(-)
MDGVDLFDCAKYGEYHCIKSGGGKIWLPSTTEAMDHLRLFVAWLFVMQQFEKIQVANPTEHAFLMSQSLGDATSRHSKNYHALRKFVKRDFFPLLLPELCFK